MSENEFEEPPIRFTDNRKIDRDDAPAAPGSDDAADLPADETLAASDADATDENARLLEERTRDLQRLSAEYANYRKRAERERLAAEQAGVSRALAAMLPVLDDWDRARDHGDLDGPLGAIVDKELRALTTLGLEAVGHEADEFDPNIHEAVLHDEADDVAKPTVTKVLRKGYRHGERLLRPAMVGVTDPTHPAPAAGEQSNAGSEAEQPADGAND